jgi:histone acetyltransferase
VPAVIVNDDSDKALIALTALKNIFAQQLPKMPKEYICRLVYDFQHESLACVFKGEIVGGVCYRPHPTQAFSEIVFCAVSAKHQVQGYGTRIMNQLKEKCKRDGIEGMLTYADNHAIGYFAKQGFSKQVTLKRERWQGYIKDYEGATLVECLVDPTINYLTTRQIAKLQLDALLKHIREKNGAVAASGLGTGYLHPEDPEVEAANRALVMQLKCSPPPVFEVKVRGNIVPLQTVIKGLFDAIWAHKDAWPFQKAVSEARVSHSIRPLPPSPSAKYIRQLGELDYGLTRVR